MIDDPTLVTILVVATAVATGALFFAIRGILRSRKMKYWGPMVITIEDPRGKKYSLQAGDLQYDDLVRLLDILDGNTKQQKPLSSQSGRVSMDAILMVVPALIALLFVCSILFMALKGSTIPDPLVNWLTVIIGYYFGVGANSVAKGRAITAEEAQRLVRRLTPTDPDDDSGEAPADRQVAPSAQRT